MKNTKKGFTLVELLVVIAILAILASVAVVGYTSFIDKAKDSNAKTEAHQLETAIEAVIMIPGDYYLLGQVPEKTEGETTTTAVPYYVVKNDAKVVVVTDPDAETLSDCQTLPNGFVFNDDILALGATLEYKGNGVFEFKSKSGGEATIDLAK